jgi:hypothetical protein
MGGGGGGWGQKTLYCVIWGRGVGQKTLILALYNMCTFPMSSCEMDVFAFIRIEDES